MEEIYHAFGSVILEMVFKNQPDFAPFEAKALV